jgi:hypothetical protein
MYLPTNYAYIQVLVPLLTVWEGGERKQGILVIVC